MSSDIAFTIKKISLIFLLLLLPLVITPENPTYAKEQYDIIIDPGHGGIDSGASFEGIVEKDIVLDISKKLEADLTQMGYKVAMTRNDDTSLGKLTTSGKDYENRDLNERVNIIDSGNTALFVSLHADSDLENPSNNGSVVYYFNSKISKSKTLANSIQNSLNNIITNKIKRASHIPSSSHFYILKNTATPGVLVETAYISNPQERKLLKTEDFREKIAYSIAYGIKNSSILPPVKNQSSKKYTAIVYPKNSSSINSNAFATLDACYAWINTKGTSGLVTSSGSPSKPLGVELDGCIISFDSDYLIKLESYQDKYDKKVVAIQKILYNLGYKVNTDGYFGQETCNAIKKFQKSYNLIDDGVVGISTYKKLAGEFKS